MFNAPAFWYEPPRTLAQRLALLALAPPARLYAALAKKRFDFHFPVPMEHPVICVGNLTAGGAGKTPVSLSLARLLKDRGHNPHFLTRGYGGTEEGPLQVAPGRDTAADVGDEALLLVREAPTWVSVNRPLGAQAAMDTGATVVIMDDGFQNPSFYKDFALVVVDGGAGFGNGRVMPAGPLRETVSFGLGRAHAVAIVGADTAGVEDEVRRHVPGMPVFRARLVPAAGNPDLSGKSVYAFAGIGRPQKFRDSLVAAGADVAGWGAFPDHFAYVEEDLKEAVEEAEARNMPLVTTAKDYVRLPAAFRDRVQVFAVDLAWDDPAALADLAGAALRRDRACG